MDNEKKDDNLRAMLITLNAVRASAMEISSKAVPRHLAQQLADQNIGVSVVELRPLRIARRRWPQYGISANPESAHVNPAGMAIHCVRWPVLACGQSNSPETFWPGAGFAFPFVASTLVEILHSQHHDILIADDIPISGHVAWRLREITGVPYVIICGPSELSTVRESKPAGSKVLMAITRDAECVLGNNMDLEKTGHDDPTVRCGLSKKMDLSGENLKELLEQAVRQSGASFDW